MKVILVMVTSINGKITNGSDSPISNWTSKEDQDYFSALIKQHNLIVMGSKTYQAAKSIIVPNKDRLRVILTRNPDDYSNNQIKGQIEFSSDSPAPLIKNLENRGFETMLLVGGGEINSLFLKENLVNEINLTFEPKLFGKGKPFVVDNDFDLDLNLISVEKLNSVGTLLLKYKVI